MAHLLGIAAGNFATLATWLIAEAGSGSVQIAYSASTSVTATTYTYNGADFTLQNNDVVGGVFLMIQRNGVTGTITVGLSVDSGSTAVKESAAINLSDLPANQSLVYIPFASAYTVSGGDKTTCRIGVKFSASSSGATVYRDGTAANWFRLLTTAANPGSLAAGDNFWLAGKAATAAPAVVMDNTASTDFGTLDIGFRIQLNLGTAASTPYLLKNSGNVNVWDSGSDGGLGNGVAMPLTSSLDWTLDCTSNVEFGIIFNNGSRVNLQGGQAVTKFTGTGLNDLNRTGTWVDTVNPGCSGVHNIEIDGTGAPDTFKWQLNGGSWTTGVAITGAAQLLSNGIYVTFAATTGHTLADKWETSTPCRMMTVARGGYCTTVGTAVTRVEGQGFTGLTGAIVINGTGYTISSVTNNDLLVLTGSAGTQATPVVFTHAGTKAVITLTSTAGMAIGDTLAFAASNRTRADCESDTIATVDSATQVTLTNGVTKYHGGVSPVQAEVINLTRNVKIHGASSSLQSYVYNASTSSVTSTSVEHYWMGSGTASKKGIDVAVTTGSSILTYCSFHDFVVSSSSINSLGSTGQTTTTAVFASNVHYNLAVGITIAATTGTTTVRANALLLVGARGIDVSDLGGALCNNVVVGSSGYGLFCSDNNPVGTFNGNVAHSCTDHGFYFSAVRNGTPGNVLAYRCDSGFGCGTLTGVVVDVVLSFGNGWANFNSAGTMIGVRIASGIFAGDAVFSSPYGLRLMANANGICLLENCSLGVSGSFYRSHTTGDIIAASGSLSTVVLRACTLGSSVPIILTSGLLPDSFVSSQRENGTAGNHKCYMPYGIVKTDSVISHTATPSMRMTPNTASVKLESAPANSGGSWGFTARVASGNALTVSVWVRKSAATDASGRDYPAGATYLPHLVLRKNVCAGIAADVILDTMLVGTAVGTWQQLTGTTAVVTDDAELEFIVDMMVDAVVSPVAWINVDDFSVTSQMDSRGFKVWADGLPAVTGDNAAGGGLLINPGLSGGLR